jgi:hypothetical protein
MYVYRVSHKSICVYVCIKGESQLHICVCMYTGWATNPYVCMYVYRVIHKSICVYVCIHGEPQIHTCVCMHVYRVSHNSICVYVCMYTGWVTTLFVCMYACTQSESQLYMCVCMYTGWATNPYSPAQEWCCSVLAEGRSHIQNTLDDICNLWYGSVRAILNPYCNSRHCTFTVTPLWPYFGQERKDFKCLSWFTSSIPW